MSDDEQKTDKKVTFVESLNGSLKRLSLSETAETVEDPFCDEKNPRVITFQDVCQAAFMIRGGVEVSPCTVSEI